MPPALARLLPPLISATLLLSGAAHAAQPETVPAVVSSCGGWTGQPTVCVAGWNPMAGCEETRKARNIAIASHNNPINTVTSAQSVSPFGCYGTGPNYATPVLYGSWWSSLSCPAATPGYTLISATQECERCPLPFTYVAASRACTGGCLPDGGAPASCNDNDACTVEGCDPIAGCTHAPRGCDDGKACTRDRCEPATGCVNDFDGGPCTCQGSAPPSFTSKPSKDLALGSMPCPAPEKGTLGATLTLSGEGSQESAWCGNDCKARASLSGTAALNVSVCGTAVSVTATGRYALDEAREKTCEPATCGTGCGTPACVTEEGSGSLSVGQSRFLGYDWSDKLPGGGKVFAKCGATLAGSVQVSGGLKEVRNGGVANCPACLSSNLALTGEASATATCSYGLTTRWGSRETGCLKCASAKTSVSGTANSQAGACGNQACNALRGNVTATLSTPSVKLGLKWMTVEAACTATVDACRETSTCGSCTCGGAACSDFKTKMTCSVCGGGSLLQACKKG